MTSEQLKALGEQITASVIEQERAERAAAKRRAAEAIPLANNRPVPRPDLSAFREQPAAPEPAKISSLAACKATIRRLTPQDRAQLILWIAQGMPAD